MTTDTISTETVATEAAQWFETATRDDGGSYVRTKDGTPEWVRDMIHEAHGDMLPDDIRYEMIREAVDHISDGGDEDSHEFADGVDIYTGSLLDWAGSNLTRLGYCDEAQSEGLAPEDADVVKLLQLGQYMERQEVYGEAWRAISCRVEDLETESAE